MVYIVYVYVTTIGVTYGGYAYPPLSGVGVPYPHFLGVM